MAHELVEHTNKYDPRAAAVACTVHTQACDSGVFTGDYHRELPDRLGVWHAEFAVCGVFAVTGFYSPPYPHAMLSILPYHI